MIDIETLGISLDAPVIQIGYVDTLGREKEWTLKMDEALAIGKMDIPTLKWWMCQSAEAGESVTSGDTCLYDAIHELNVLLKKVDHVWAHASFDFPLLVQATTKINPSPRINWNYKNLRDLRTIEHFFGDKIEWEERTGNHHTALDDARYQMKHLLKMLEIAEG